MILWILTTLGSAIWAVIAMIRLSEPRELLNEFRVSASERWILAVSLFLYVIPFGLMPYPLPFLIFPIPLSIGCFAPFIAMGSVVRNRLEASGTSRTEALEENLGISIWIGYLGAAYILVNWLLGVGAVLGPGSRS